MEKMLVVIFNDESKAYEGSRALKQLDAEGSMTIYAEAVIKKNADGTATVKQVDDGFPYAPSAERRLAASLDSWEDRLA